MNPRDQQNSRGRRVETDLNRHVNLYPFFFLVACDVSSPTIQIGNESVWRQPMAYPQVGEINIPRLIDAAERCSLYDGFTTSNLAWINCGSE